MLLGTNEQDLVQRMGYPVRASPWVAIAFWAGARGNERLARRAALWRRRWLSTADVVAACGGGW